MTDDIDISDYTIRLVFDIDDPTPKVAKKIKSLKEMLLKATQDNASVADKLLLTSFKKNYQDKIFKLAKDSNFVKDKEFLDAFNKILQARTASKNAAINTVLAKAGIETRSPPPGATVAPPPEATVASPPGATALTPNIINALNPTSSSKNWIPVFSAAVANFANRAWAGIGSRLPAASASVGNFMMKSATLLGRSTMALGGVLNATSSLFLYRILPVSMIAARMLEQLVVVGAQKNVAEGYKAGYGGMDYTDLKGFRFAEGILGTPQGTLANLAEKVGSKMKYDLIYKNKLEGLTGIKATGNPADDLMPMFKNLWKMVGNDPKKANMLAGILDVSTEELHAFNPKNMPKIIDAMQKYQESQQGVGMNKYLDNMDKINKASADLSAAFEREGKVLINDFAPSILKAIDSLKGFSTLYEDVKPNVKDVVDELKTIRQDYVDTISDTMSFIFRGKGFNSLPYPINDSRNYFPPAILKVIDSLSSLKGFSTLYENVKSSVKDVVDELKTIRQGHVDTISDIISDTMSFISGGKESNSFSCPIDDPKDYFSKGKFEKQSFLGVGPSNRLAVNQHNVITINGVDGNNIQAKVVNALQPYQNAALRPFLSYVDTSIA